MAIPANGSHNIKQRRIAVMSWNSNGYDGRRTGFATLGQENRVERIRSYNGEEEGKRVYRRLINVMISASNITRQRTWQHRMFYKNNKTPAARQNTVAITLKMILATIHKTQTPSPGGEEKIKLSISSRQGFAREEYEEHRLEEESLEGIEIALRARGLKAKLSPLVEIIVAVGTSLVLWFGGRMVLNGSLSAGSLVVFILWPG